MAVYYGIIGATSDKSMAGTLATVRTSFAPTVSQITTNPSTRSGNEILLLIVLLIVAALCVFLAWRSAHTARKYRTHIQELTYFDSLTELPNWQKMQQEISRAGMGTLALFDVKSFKLYNELFGHEYGDKLLLGIAKKLREMAKNDILICRCQSDCFGLFFRTDSEYEIRKQLQTMFDDLQKQEGTHKISMRFACGVAPIYEIESGDLTVLFDCANFARNAAKNSAKTEIVFFDGKAKRDMIAQQTLTGELDEATLQGDLIVVYQPQYSLRDGQMVGAEALIRWQHPERGLLMPDVFVPAFVENGSIERIDEYILEKVLDQMDEWRRSGIAVLPVSVNLSRAFFANPTAPERLIQMLQKREMSPGVLHLELTEDNLLGDIDTVVTTISQLRKMGFAILMDDFGSGYSSLGLLRRLPLDVLKLDKSFLVGIESDGRQQHFVQDIISMTHHMGVLALIEGVESIEQAQLMRTMGCDFAQGFWFNRPLGAKELSELLQGNKISNKH